MTFSCILERTVKKRRLVLVRKLFYGYVKAFQDNRISKCFDNWFCTMQLLLTMQSLGIPTTATSRANRLAGCPLKSDKELKKDSRGSSSYKTDANSGILMLGWYDNKSVQLVSTFRSPDSAGTVKRWDSKF